jgi:hypothetical protein
MAAITYSEPEKATKFHILKKLQLEGKTYNRGDQPTLDLPDELRDDLIKQGVMRLPDLAATDAEVDVKKVK